MTYLATTKCHRHRKLSATPFVGMTREEALLKLDLKQGSIWQKTAMK